MSHSLLLTTRAVVAIAINTFREAIRNKIFGALLVFAGGTLAFSLVLGVMSLHQEIRVATDVSLFASSVFCAVITIFVSVNLLHTEIDRRTIHTILSKPVRRWQFLLGKFLGVVALMATIVVALFGLSTVLRSSVGGEFTGAFSWAFVCIFFQICVVAATALLFASFSTPIVSGLLTFGVFAAGHLHDKLSEVEQFFESAVILRMLDVAAFVLPDLASMNLSHEVVHEVAVPTAYIATAGWYAASYSMLVFLLAAAIFAYRDLA